jgi:predicted phosphohydrolase
MDIPELQDEQFDVNGYLNGNYDYWWLSLLSRLKNWMLCSHLLSSTTIGMR